MGELSAIPLIEGEIREDAQRNIILLAREFDLTAYDAAYLELAIRLDSKLATLDADLLKLKRIFNWIE